VREYRLFCEWSAALPQLRNAFLGHIASTFPWGRISGVSLLMIKIENLLPTFFPPFFVLERFTNSRRNLPFLIADVIVAASPLTPQLFQRRFLLAAGIVGHIGYFCLVPPFPFATPADSRDLVREIIAARFPEPKTPICLFWREDCPKKPGTQKAVVLNPLRRLRPVRCFCSDAFPRRKCGPPTDANHDEKIAPVSRRVFFFFRGSGTLFPLSGLYPTMRSFSFVVIALLFKDRSSFPIQKASLPLLPRPFEPF